MMKFKKFLAAAMMFGAVAVAAPAVAVYASTASKTTTTPDYENMTITVVTDDPYLNVDVLKSESDKAKPSKSYTYEVEGGSVTIDLGFLKIKKENFLNIYGSTVEATDGEVLKIPAQPVKEKLTVDVTKDSLAAALGKTDAQAELYEYRSSFGNNWSDFAGFNFKSAKVAGTTIVVRLAAVTEEGKGTPAGPEAKIKIPASPKAPKVTVDYVKDSVKVTDKMQIALLPTSTTSGGSGSSRTTEIEWHDAKKGMSRSDIVKELGIADADAAKEFSIVVRTASNGKKAASMPTIVKIKAAPVLTAGSGDAAATATIDETEVKIQADKTDKGIKFTITGNVNFQYDKGGNKWANISSGQEIKTSASTVKVRIAPEKEDKKTAGSGAFGSEGVTLTAATKEDEGTAGGSGTD